MASKFFERNKAKKKGLLALLLLLLRNRKSAVALLVVLLLMLAFMAPKKTAPMFFRALDSLPFIGHYLSRTAQRYIVVNDKEDDDPAGRTSSLSAAFRAAREKGAKAWNLFAAASDARKAGAVLPGDSVGMVRGKRDALFGDDDADGTGRGGAGGKNGKRSVAGILNPEDGAHDESGVRINAEDMTGERAQYYEAGMGGMFGMDAAGAAGLARGADYAGGAISVGATSKAFLAGVGAYAKADFFKGADKVANKVDHLTTALESSRVPNVESRVQAVNQGRMSRYRPEDAAGRAARGNRNPIRAGRALRQLAEGRARAMVARETVDGVPMCAASNGCPPEYAAVNVGAVYDGWRVGSRNSDFVMAGTTPGAGAGVSPSVDGIAVPNVNIPTDGQLQTYIDEANTINNDAEECARADATYQPLEDQALSDYLAARARACSFGCTRGTDSMQFGQKAQSMGFLAQICCAIKLCGSCGSYKSQQRWNQNCQNLVGGVEAQCSAIDQLRYQHYMACPTRRQENNFQYRCGVPPDQGGYNIPPC